MDLNKEKRLEIEWYEGTTALPPTLKSFALAITNGIEECKKEDICICNSPHVTQMGLGKCVRTTLPDASYYELYRTLREMYLKLAIAKQLHEDCAKTHAKNTSPNK